MTTTTKALTAAPALRAEQLADWLDAYGSAWEAGDGDAAARRSATMPATTGGRSRRDSRAAQRSRAWSVATNDQREVRFEHTTLAITADRAVVHWRATFTPLLSGARTELDGVFVLRFDERGACIELRGWWLERKFSR